jgi:endonuclease/exonuclease/phosphatase family metal-dependent hydrolase
LLTIIFFCILHLTTAADFSVGSYNIHQQEELSGLALDFAQLKTIDVLALQEVQIDDGAGLVFSQSLLPLLNKSVDNQWNFHCAQRVNQNADGTWESLALFSRYPLLKCGALPLEHSDIKKREALWAVVGIPQARPLLVINTDHETSSYLTLGFPDRKKQLKSLVKHLKSCAQWLEPGCETWPTVVTGDFNTSGVSLSSPLATLNEIKQTISLLQTAHLEYVVPCSEHEPTFESLWGSYQLDHLFIKNLRSTCRLSLKNRQGSDHLPIWSVLSQ